MFSLLVINLVDAYYIGKLGVLELSAISYAFPVLFTLMSFNIGIAIGISATVSKYIGQGDLYKAKKTVSNVMVLIFLLPGPVFADEKIRGKYEVIGDINKLKGVKTIKMLEFFNYSCGHCYRFLETSKKLRAKFKDKLHHKKYPIYWGNQTAYPSMAFYITDNLGLEEEFTQELFDTNFKLNINIFQPKVIRFLAKEFKIEKEMKEVIVEKSWSK